MAKTKTATAKKATPKKAAPKKTSAKKVVKKVNAKKTVAKKTSQKIANNKSKIAPYKSKKNEKYMSAAMKRHFVAVLLLWKEHLLDEMQKTFDHLKAKGETYADPVDRASQEEEFAFELRTRDRERKLISKINKALRKIEDGTYGYCEETNQPISLKRLIARPIATLSLEAQESHEKSEKIYKEKEY